MDRKDGTGKAHRERKAGGEKKWEGKDGEEEEVKGAAEEEKPRERKPKAEPVVEEEEEEVGYTLADYEADKAAKSQGLLAAAAVGRKHEKNTDKVATRTETKVHVEGRANNLGARDMYAVKPDANAALLGFSAPVDDEFEERGAGRGRGRGGRGGADRGPREPRQGGRKGGRGGKLVVDDDAFPTLG